MDRKLGEYVALHEEVMSGVTKLLEEIARRDDHIIKLNKNYEDNNRQFEAENDKNLRQIEELKNNLAGTLYFTLELPPTNTGKFPKN